MQEQLTHVSPIDVNRNCTVATELNVTNATRNPDLYVIIFIIIIFIDLDL